VVVALVAAGPVEETVTNTRAGSVRALRRAKLSPEIGGLVVALPFREGERVQSGDVVLRLDDSLQRAELALAERELGAALAQRDQSCLAAELAERERSRMARLTSEGIISRDLLDRAETEARSSAAACEAARSSVERAEAAVALARTRVEKMTLTAPFDAVVAEVDAEIGEWVTPSPPALPVPPVVDILDPSSIYVTAPMDEVDSARIEVGLEVRISVDSFPGEHFRGKVTRIAPYVLDVETQNRTVEIEVSILDGANVSRLLPGTSADVEVILEKREGVLRVPTPALLEGDRILLVGPGEVLESRTIAVGISNWDYTEVRQGLEPGDRVVVSLDRPDVEEGARVRVEAEEGAP
jgi:HlyD family secretion protein